MSWAAPVSKEEQKEGSFLTFNNLIMHRGGLRKGKELSSGEIEAISAFLPSRSSVTTALSVSV